MSCYELYTGLGVVQGFWYDGEDEPSKHHNTSTDENAKKVK